MKQYIYKTLIAIILLVSIQNHLKAQCIADNIEVPKLLELDERGNAKMNLIARTKGVKNARVWVFDQWGNKVFQSSVSVMNAKEKITKELDTGWDGKKNGTQLKAGLYVYSIEATCFDDTHIRRGGTVTLAQPKEGAKEDRTAY